MNCVGSVDCDCIQYKVSVKHCILMLCVVLIRDVAMVQCVSVQILMSYFTLHFIIQSIKPLLCVLLCVHASVCVFVSVFSVLLIGFAKTLHLHTSDFPTLVIHNSRTIKDTSVEFLHIVK